MGDKEGVTVKEGGVKVKLLREEELEEVVKAEEMVKAKG